LWKLGQNELKHVLFPLADLKKDDVRDLALEAGLTVAKRKDSQGICFVGNVEAREFLARRLKEKPGKVVDKDGEVIGSHDGVWFYTVGQRGGWELTPEAQKKYVTKYKTPVFYVISKDAKENVLVVGEADEATQDSFEANEVNIISDTKWKMDDLKARIRHGGELVGARVEFIDIDSRLRGNDKVDNSKIKSVFVVLDKSMRGVASGQSVVFYSNEGECLGGGVIA
jgi:tRNA-specific 2-thiouridylase